MRHSASLPSAAWPPICCSGPEVPAIPRPGDRAGSAAAIADLSWLAEPFTDLEVLAELWATVELERALSLVAAATGEAGDRAGDRAGDPADPMVGRVAEDPLLGARVVIVAVGGGGRAAVAEPSTEGRLAATLARHGEGPAGHYVRAPVSLATVRQRAAAAGLSISRAVTGPFGTEILVLGGPNDGPHLILVDPAAVPSRS